VAWLPYWNGYNLCWQSLVDQLSTNCWHCHGGGRFGKKPAEQADFAHHLEIFPCSAAVQAACGSPSFASVTLPHLACSMCESAQLYCGSDEVLLVRKQQHRALGLCV
jgi:hypothetical protein